MDYGLTDKKVVIVGASRGIGLEIAKGFIAQQAIVTIASQAPEVFDVRDELAKTASRPVEALQFDISERAQVIEAFAKLGPVDVLINNVGVFLETPTTDRSQAAADLFMKQLLVNVAGGYWCSQEAVPHMSEGGRIIFTASISGKVGSASHSGYAASKHAVLGMIKSMAIDLGPLGIAVNAVCPGSSSTEINLESLGPDRIRWVVRRMPLHGGALIEPSQHVGTYLFLASEAASEITGQSITVDRGQTLGAG
jgi:NAD(P)-dependent dehydrogenase (short-subunit alcohol dehydrogenase family)